jgi:hypothetical protein
MPHHFFRKRKKKSELALSVITFLLTGRWLFYEYIFWNWSIIEVSNYFIVEQREGHCGRIGYQGQYTL